MLENKQVVQQYDLVARCIHWFVAILVLIMLPLGFIMQDIASEHMGFYYTLHKSLGIIVLFLMLFRVVWQLTHKPPAYYSRLPKLVKILAKASHGFMYLALIVMPLSGWVMSTASGRAPDFLYWFHLPLPGVPLSSKLSGFAYHTHNIFFWVVSGLLALHFMALMVHQCVFKDAVLQRMLPKKYDE